MVGRLSAHRAALLLLFILLLAVAPPTPAAPPTASGIGARDCSAFSFALERDSEAALDAYVSWAQGFIAGFNWANVRQRNVEVDAAGLINWLGQYCGAHPASGVYAAIQELIRLEAH